MFNLGILAGLISDLHLERYLSEINENLKYYKRNPEKLSELDYLLELSPPTRKLDVLFLAGDISEFRYLEQLTIPFLKKIQDYADQIVYIAGNHEFWSGHIQREQDYANKIKLAVPNFIYLSNNSVNIKGLEIFGSTLWTDYGKNEYLITQANEKYSDLPKDHNINKIKFNNGKFHANKIVYLALKNKSEINKWLNETPLEQPKLLLTHYPPFPDKVNLSYLLDKERLGDNYEERLALVNLLDHNNLSDIIDGQQNILFAHGHLHTVGNYTKGNFNVYSNPKMHKTKEEELEYKIFEFKL